MPPAVRLSAAVLQNFTMLEQWRAWLAKHHASELLLFTGLYLFALPYAVRWRSARRAGE